MEWLDRDQFKLSSGRVVHANRGLVGINPRLEVSQGYDGNIYIEDDDEPWTPEERAELADAMIARWQEFKGR
jgi:hypothetical protein